MKLALAPIDTWFFRDGTPFDMGESPQSGVLGVFPPYPPTVAGAIRAALALQNGWDGHARWSREIEAVLGDGPENLGRLQITGPFVLHRGVPVFPMPHHVVGRFGDDSQWLPAAMLRPGAAIALSDLGSSARLPEIAPGIADPTSLAPAARYWVTLGGLGRILQGELPRSDDILREDDLWAGEPRVGIARESSSRTVAEGALYSTRHVRLRPSVRIGVEVDGVPGDWRSPAGSVLPFGGESRLAACESWEASTAVPLDVPSVASNCNVLVALTPLLLERDVVRGRSYLHISGARIVSACADRPLRIGGWDSLRRAPLPLRNAVAPGSTLFCEVESPDALRKEITGGLLRVGAMTTAGFGLCAVGNAPTWERTT
jgi:CRISPR-associated protein Cmr3